MLAPLPDGITDHFGPELKRFILAQYHQGQTTVQRLVDLLQGLGVAISKRQVVRILTGSNDRFVTEAQDVLRAGLKRASARKQRAAIRKCDDLARQLMAR